MNFKSALGGLLFLGLLAYANAVGNPFVHDDIVFILQNPQVHALHHLGDVFTNTSFAPANIAVANAYYRPFLDLIYRLEYFFFGPHPAGYHIFNILLHLINGILIFLLTRKLTGRLTMSWALAVLFILHPVQTESTACISGISNLLFAFFCLLSFVLYLKITDASEELTPLQQGLYFSGALIAFGMALLCKEQAIIFPALIALYEFVLPTGLNNRSAGWRLRLSGLAIVAGGYLLWRELLLGGSMGGFVANAGEFYLRLKSIPAMILMYLRILIFPNDLHYYRSYDILSSWTLPLLGMVFVLIFLGAMHQILPQHRKRLFAFGIGWFLICLLPTSLAPLIHEYSWIAAFEHFLYLPLWGFLLCAFIIVEYLIEKFFLKQSPAIKQTVFTVLMLSCFIMTVQQNPVWAGEISLFKRAVKFENSLGRVHLLLAKAYYFNNDFSHAQVEFIKSREIMANYLAKVKDPKVLPFYEGFLKESMLGIAGCRQAMSDFTGAIQQYEQILKLSPGDSAVENNLGFIAIRMEKWDQAVLHFEQALKAEPRNVQVLTNLGVCYIQAGHLDKAEEKFRSALSVDPNFLTAQKNLEQVIKQKKQELTK